jgi:hypothetical protein
LVFASGSRTASEANGFAAGTGSCGDVTGVAYRAFEGHFSLGGGSVGDLAGTSWDLLRHPKCRRNPGDLAVFAED